MAGYILCAALLCSLISSKLIPFCILYPLLAGTLEDMGVSPSKEMFPLALTCIACLGILPIGSGAASFAQSNAYLQASSVTEYAFVATNTFMGRWPVLVVCVLYAIFLAPKLAPDRPPVDIKARENAAAGRAVNKEAMDPFHEKCGYIVFFAVSIGLLLSSTLGVPPGLSPLWVRCWWYHRHDEAPGGGGRHAHRHLAAVRGGYASGQRAESDGSRCHDR